MVRELHVEDPNEGKLSQEKEEALLHEFVYLGIELPDEVAQQRREKLGFFPSERDPSAARAQMLWDAYHVWLAGRPELVDSTPAQRLSLYAAELAPKQEK